MELWMRGGLLATSTKSSGGGGRSCIVHLGFRDVPVDIRGRESVQITARMPFLLPQHTNIHDPTNRSRSA